MEPIHQNPISNVVSEGKNQEASSPTPFTRNRIVILMLLVVGVLLIGFAFTLLKKPAPLDDSLRGSLDVIPQKQISREQKNAIMQSLSGSAPKTVTETERQNILKALTQ